MSRNRNKSLDSISAAKKGINNAVNKLLVTVEELNNTNSFFEPSNLLSITYIESLRQKYLIKLDQLSKQQKFSEEIAKKINSENKNLNEILFKKSLTEIQNILNGYIHRFDNIEELELLFKEYEIPLEIERKNEKIVIIDSNKENFLSYNETIQSFKNEQSEIKDEIKQLRNKNNHLQTLKSSNNSQVNPEYTPANINAKIKKAFISLSSLEGIFSSKEEEIQTSRAGYGIEGINKALATLQISFFEKNNAFNNKLKLIVELVYLADPNKDEKEKEIIMQQLLSSHDALKQYINDYCDKNDEEKIIKLLKAYSDIYAVEFIDKGSLIEISITEKIDFNESFDSLNRELNELNSALSYAANINSQKNRQKIEESIAKWKESYNEFYDSEKKLKKVFNPYNFNEFDVVVEKNLDPYLSDLKLKIIKSKLKNEELTSIKNSSVDEMCGTIKEMQSSITEVDHVIKTLTKKTEDNFLQIKKMIEDKKLESMRLIASFKKIAKLINDNPSVYFGIEKHTLDKLIKEINYNYSLVSVENYVDFSKKVDALKEKIILLTGNRFEDSIEKIYTNIAKINVCFDDFNKLNQLEQKIKNKINLIEKNFNLEEFLKLKTIISDSITLAKKIKSINNLTGSISVSINEEINNKIDLLANQLKSLHAYDFESVFIPQLEKTDLSIPPNYERVLKETTFILQEIEQIDDEQIKNKISAAILNSFNQTLLKNHKITSLNDYTLNLRKTHIEQLIDFESNKWNIKNVNAVKDSVSFLMNKIGYDHNSENLDLQKKLIAKIKEKNLLKNEDIPFTQLIKNIVPPAPLGNMPTAPSTKINLNTLDHEVKKAIKDIQKEIMEKNWNPGLSGVAVSFTNTDGKKIKKRISLTMNEILNAINKFQVGPQLKWKEIYNAVSKILEILHNRELKNGLKFFSNDTFYIKQIRIFEGLKANLDLQSMENKRKKINS